LVLVFAELCFSYKFPKLQVPYATPNDAQDAVRRGDAWGVLYFTENFTDALVARMALGKDSDEETLDQSEIRVWLDMSSKLLVNRGSLQDCGWGIPPDKHHNSMFQTTL
jgi:hypothetical protein